MSPAAADSRALADLATGVARQAGTLLLDGLGGVRRQVGTKSSSTDMVTEMDHASERLIVDALLRARPDDGVLGEEGSERTGSSGVRWVIDPLDGTTNYLYGHPGFAVSIAAELEGVVVAGVVFDPIHDQLFRATRGGGASLDGSTISPAATSRLADALVATGFAYAPAQRAEQAAALVRILPEIRDIRRMGAAAVDLCSVACGRVDAFFEQGLAPWDVAAGALIAAEAGAVVSGLDGGEPQPGSVLAAAPGIAGALVRLLAAAGSPGSRSER